jgi:phage recombination protein Bet
MQKLVTTGTGASVPASGLHHFTPEQVQLIKSLIAPKATDDELLLFLHYCTKTKLDPLARQIYCIHRRVKVKKQDDRGRWYDDFEERMTIQTSIDGFRVIAERTGQYGGVSEPEFFYDEKGIMDYCRIIVYRWRGDVRYEAAVAVAYWAEYAAMYDGQPTGMWAKMPHGQISKVTEALALRKAFPQDLGGMYIEEEMDQADNTEQEQPKPAETVQAPPPPAAVTTGDDKIVWDAHKLKQRADDAMRERVLAVWKEWNDIAPEDAKQYHYNEWDKERNRSFTAYLRVEELLKNKIATFEKVNP